jgi:hypothetical protein
MLRYDLGYPGIRKVGTMKPPDSKVAPRLTEVLERSPIYFLDHPPITALSNVVEFWESVWRFPKLVVSFCTLLAKGICTRRLGTEAGFSAVPSHVGMASTCCPAIVNRIPEVGVML